MVCQLQMRVAVLEQEIKDKEQLMCRTKEVLESTQQQKESIEENVECKELQMKKLEATVKSLSEELLKANNIIKNLQGEVRGLVGKIKVKNTVTVSQEKVLQETSEKLQNLEKDFNNTQQQLNIKDEQFSKLKEQLDSTVQKLNESQELLKTNENVISWLNKQLNENQLSKKSLEPSNYAPASSALNGLKTQLYHLMDRAPVSPVAPADSPPAEQRAAQASTQLGGAAGLDSKYFERRDVIPIYGLSSNVSIKENSRIPTKHVGSAYFSS